MKFESECFNQFCYDACAAAGLEWLSMKIEKKKPQ